MRVKFLYRGAYGGNHDAWLRQFPSSRPQWGGCRFVFDPDERGYDWLAVYHDLPPTRRDGRPTVETLACPRARTILVTSEPSTITTYGTHYLAQYGRVLTSQEPECIRHRGIVHSQAGFPWFYGRCEGAYVGYDELRDASPPGKDRLVSTVCSTKQQRHTYHARRYAFTERLKAELPVLDVFGHGVMPVDDKAQALDRYRYHLAIENHIAPHHWTEKLADAFLGFTLPFYSGCPNAHEYFPPESFIPLDLDDFDAAVETIREAIRTDQFSRRRGAIAEARRRVLEEYNLFATLAALIERSETQAEGKVGEELLCRPAYWSRYPLARLHCLGEKLARRVQSQWRRRVRG